MPDGMDQSYADDKETRLPLMSKVILGIAIGLTLLFLITAVSAAFTVCSSVSECLKLNEWGDFVAGTFAPIAFVWLVVAVVLQTIELREQRKELALTRCEFQQNRTVMEAQVQEARNQGALMAAQTDLLARSAADAAFMTMISHLRLWYEDTLKKPIVGVPYGKQYPSDYIFVQLVSNLFYRSDMLDTYRFYNEFEPFVEAFTINGLKELCNFLVHISQLREQVSSSVGVIFDNSDVVHFVSRFVEGEEGRKTLYELLTEYETWEKNRSAN